MEMSTFASAQYMAQTLGRSISLKSVTCYGAAAPLTKWTPPALLDQTIITFHLQNGSSKYMPTGHSTPFSAIFFVRPHTPQGKQFRRTPVRVPLLLLTYPRLGNFFPFLTVPVCIFVIQSFVVSIISIFRILQPPPYSRNSSCPKPLFCHVLLLQAIKSRIALFRTRVARSSVLWCAQVRPLRGFLPLLVAKRQFPLRL